METQIIEGALGKIGGLLAIGLGEAGSKIVAENLSKGNEVNPMLPGQKMMCIFGFCDIRNFTDATEVLQEGVMLFVNEIGEIVHSVVDMYSGAANKNIGDAFLFVWKFDEADTDVNKRGEMVVKRNSSVSTLCDMSIISFALMFAELSKSSKMSKYNDHVGLNERMPNYRVRLGCGLHLGYGIEGAIGSYFKIDPTYLSPDVNLSMRLEGATKAFGVPLLISGSLIKNCTKKMQSYSRQIDYVTLAGNDEPLKLYTVDLDPSKIETEAPGK